ncbi:FAD-binding protein [Herbiconiux sp. CPCC 203407]|uniref:FAD-binding protein n=1 Tax=Herbiconiux oxytropis TaxID=2970915 RepID=A0AA41XIV5_9MICO|nr:D-arabinono-1,4-lactone oxidase [Herbiconiux oxytropis]MCS5724198.1 FAD-binding protein [Herbiconiux oxytropis]MCS5726798.1 FAD-binding protein [Herbiconiux oxytropis]
MTDVGATWAGTHVFGAVSLRRPTSVDELQRVIRQSDRVRALGTRHSFNDIADTEGELVTVGDPGDPGCPGDVTALGAGPVVALDRRTVDVPAGIRYGALALALEAEGLALHNLGSLPHISVAGATATGTHGSGVGNGSLSTAVAALEFVDGRGEPVRLARGDEGFDGAVVHLGALGVVTRLVLDVQPTYRVRQDVFVDLPWESVLADPEAVLSAGYSVSLFADWRGETLKQAWVKTRLEEGEELPATLFGGDFFGARPSTAKVMTPAGDDLDNTTVQGGVPGSWAERLPHFRLDATPSAGDEIQSEYFVARSDAAAALTAVRALASRIAPHLLVTELRSVAADELWLSPAYGRDSLAIHFTWRNEPQAVRELLPLIEQALEPFDVRPHWGKWFSLGASQVVPRYERIDDFRALAERHDPEHRLRNAYLERVLGLPR